MKDHSYDLNRSLKVVPYNWHYLVLTKQGQADCHSVDLKITSELVTRCCVVQRFVQFFGLKQYLFTNKT